ncbi:hypothetical protein PACTADRAFT_59469 [Pachysolen tannophilus NRRL Y-2460]|uniref:Mitochondrial distribution and morphology protein 31 n=1 Tax=Pachysolen tannophilus NRRL Y-2460 TaxID=669874 RepID=A0A1E4TT08_PACTA|nr:hypothetical protein PACTADRAFT_59469 [Pachysolen tannophilus NRRL Y-2460]
MAKNFPEKLYIRLKWLLIKSVRPFNTDDFSAFFSWIVIGNVALIIVGTTTFVSLVLYTVNTVFAQEFVAKAIGNFITKNSKLTVIFESAIVPSWRDGKILFKKCFVCRRPASQKKFEKGSQTNAVAAAAAAAAAVTSIKDKKDNNNDEEEYDDGNYTQFDLTIDEVSVSLSFSKWVNGKGILKEVEVKGMRGVIDRAHVYWEEGDLATNYKNIHQPGDWEIENFKMEDVLFTLMQPNNFRVFNVSIFNADLPILRKNWLFYDILNARNMSGTYDDSLFTIHKKQRFNDFNEQSNFRFNDNNYDSNNDEENSPWKRVTRLRVDNLNVDHLNTGLDGPFGWISSGNVDMIGDIMVPEEESLNIKEVVSIIAKSISKETSRYYHAHKNRFSTAAQQKDISKYFVLDLQIRLRNVRAAVPLFTPELSYVNSALIRPIVGYINSKKTYIAIKCQVIKNIQDFDGSWTIYDSLLMDDISAEVYDAFVNYVADEQVRTERAKKITFWSLQFFLQILLWSLGTIA